MEEIAKLTGQSWRYCGLALGCRVWFFALVPLDYETSGSGLWFLLFDLVRMARVVAIARA